MKYQLAKPLVLLVVCMTCPGIWAQAANGAGARVGTEASAQDYAYGWDLRVKESADFYEFEVPLEVYRSSTDARLRDVGVYDSNGQAVPRIVVTANPTEKTTEARINLPLLPLETPQSVDLNDLKLQLSQNADQTSLTFNSGDLRTRTNETGTNSAGTVLRAYVIDLRDSPRNIDRLEVFWPDELAPFVGLLQVHASDDLRSWSSLGSGTIADLRNEGLRIEHRVIDVARHKKDFLRLTWQDVPADFSLSQVTAITRNVRSVSRQELLTLSPCERHQDGGLVYCPGAELPVNQINLSLPDTSTTVTATIYLWNERGQSWMQVYSGLFFQLRGQQLHGVSRPLRNDPIEIGVAVGKRWKVNLTRGQVAVEPKLVLGWRPDQIIFVSQPDNHGNEGYQLVAGRAADAGIGFPHHQMGDPTLLKLARNSDHRSQVVIGPRHDLSGPASLSVLPRRDWTRWLVWGALGLAVLLVGWMAMRLFRQMDNEQSDES